MRVGMDGVDDHRHQFSNKSIIMANITEDLSSLLNPENLTEQSLIYILQQRMVMIDDVNKVTKEALVDLFHRTVTPQPQRVMRNNRLGKLLKCRQEKIASLKPKTDELPNLLTTSKQPASKPHCSGGLVMSTSISSNSGFRLKPPPIVLNKKNCIVKLKRSSEINQDKSHPNGKILKLKSPISSLASSSPITSMKSATATSKNLAVKRPSQQTEQNAVSDCSPKKKLNKITWP